mgnify:CR=1 FL=1
MTCRWLRSASLLAFLVLALAPSLALANGSYSHIHISQLAVEELPPGPIQTLLSDPLYAPMMEAGSMFPDSGYAIESPLGWMPRYEDLNWEGLDFPKEKFKGLMAVTKESGNLEAHAHEELFDRFFDRLPKEFVYERELLRSRLWRSPNRWELLAGAETAPGGL